MTRGHEEVSISQVERRWGRPRETPNASSLVVEMFVEELGLYIQIPAKISLEKVRRRSYLNRWGGR